MAALSAAIAVVLGIGIWLLASRPDAPTPPPTPTAAAPTYAVREHPTGDVAEETKVLPRALVTGMCLTVMPDANVAGTAVPCRTEHDLEVFTVGRFPDGPYPGDVAVARDSLLHCRTEALPFFAALPEEQRGLIWVGRSWPNETNWDATAVHRVACVIFANQGQRLIGSFVAGDAEVR